MKAQRYFTLHSKDFDKSGSFPIITIIHMQIGVKGIDFS